MTANSACLSELEVVELAAGPEDSQRGSHLESCVACASRVAEFRREQSSIQRLLAGLSSYRPDSPPTLIRKPAGANQGYQPRLSTGYRIDKYRILKFKGAGGQSEAYLVDQENLDPENSRFILKLVRTHDREGRAINSDNIKVCRQLLESEANLLNKLRKCPGIPRFMDFGRFNHEGSLNEPFLVMEWIEGRSLRQCFEEFQTDWKKSVSLIAQVAAAVGDAHSLGICHGDLKPENVVIQPDGGVKVIDFGMSRVRDLWDSGQSGESVGLTPRYVSPEQARGEELRVGTATDVFSLGVMLQELLTGRPIYAGVDALEILQRAKQGVLSIAASEELPDFRLYPLLSQCLAVDPSQRIANGAELATRLRSLIAAEPQKKNRPLQLAFLWTAVLVACGLLWSYFALRPGSIPPEKPAAIAAMLGFGEDALPGQLHRPVSLGETVLLETSVQPDADDCRWFVVWIDSRREVNVYGESGEFPVAHAAKERVIRWPGGNEGLRIGGQGGTEMIWLIGASPESKLTEEALKNRVAKVLETQVDWPEIDSHLAILANRERVETVKAEGTERGPGKKQTIAYRQMEDNINQIRSELAKDCSFLQGEAFFVENSGSPAEVIFPAQ